MANIFVILKQKLIVYNFNQIRKHSTWPNNTNNSRRLTFLAGTIVFGNEAVKISRKEQFEKSLWQEIKTTQKKKKINRKKN